MPNVGIGTTTPDPNYKMDIATTSTATTGSIAGQHTKITHSPTASATGAKVYGSYTEATTAASQDLFQLTGSYTNTNYSTSDMTNSVWSVDGSNANVTVAGAGSFNYVAGMTSNATFSASGTGNGYGIKADFLMDGTGTLATAAGGKFTSTTNKTLAYVANSYGVFAESKTALGTVTDAYGIYSMVTQTGGTTTNAYGVYIGHVQGSNANSKWSLYTSDSAAPSYFAGNVGIGVPLPATKLDVNGSVRVGADATSCAAGIAGAIRYNGGNVEYCNGTAWTPLAASGAGITSLNGLTGNTQTFATPGTSGNAPNWSFAGSTHTLNIPMAAASGSVTAGLISNADYASMMAKQSNALANNKVWIGNASGGAEAHTLSGDATIDNTGLATLKSVGTAGTYFKVVTDAQGRVTSGSALAGSDVAAALGYTPVNKAGDSMGGDLITQNLNITNGKYLGLGTTSTAGTVAGQMWFESGFIKYFDGTATQSLGVSGAGITSLNGLNAVTQSFVTGSAGNAPAIASAGSTHTLNIPMASAGSVTAGLISNADYVAFNSKQSSALSDSYVWIGNSTNGAEAHALSGDATISNAGLVTVDKTQTGNALKIQQLDSSGVAKSLGIGLINSGTVRLLPGTPATASYDLKLPIVAPANNQILKSDATGSLSWVTYLAQVSDSAPLADGKMWIGNGSNIAVEQTMSGDATISNAGLLTLKSVGTAGTYFKVVTDAQGRVTSGSALASGDVTTALGYTPANGGNYVAKSGDTMTGALNLPSDGLSVGTSQLVVSGGNVGIGTATPNYALDVAGVYVPIRAKASALTADVLRLEGHGDPSAVFKMDNPYGSTTDTFRLRFTGVDTNPQDVDLATITGAQTQNGVGNHAGYMAFSTAKSGALHERVRISEGGNVGIGTTGPNAAALLDLTSTTQGFLLPRMTAVQRNAITTPPAGLQIYNTDSSSVEFYNGTVWTALAASVTNKASLTNGSIWIGNGSGIAGELVPGTANNILYGSSTSAWASGTANTAGLVDKTTAQTIAGVKTFSSTITSNIASGSNAVDAANGNIRAGTGGSSVAGGGQIYAAAFDATASGTIDFNKGNIQTTTYDCTGSGAASKINLTNMQSGGSYTLVVTGGTGGKCTLQHAGTDIADTQYAPTNAARTSGKTTIYTIIKVGNVVYISWIQGFG